MTSETSPSPAPAVGRRLTVGAPPFAAPASGICSRLAIESSGLVSRRKMRRPFWVLAAACVERLGVQHAGADVLALQFGAELQQHRGARLQHVAVLREPFGKQHRLEMSGRIRQAHDAHLVAGLGAPFHPRHHGGRHLAGGRAGLHGAGKLRPRLHPQPLQRDGVVVERMAGQEEADGVVFAAQPLGRQPRLDLRQHDGRRVGGAAEHVVLTDGDGLVAALACRQDGIGAGEHPRAVRVQRIEGAGGGEALDDALVDRARIDPRGEIRKRGEQARLARLDDQVDRLPADALERRQRVVDGVVADLEGRRRSG